MTTQHDTRDGLNDLAAVASQREPSVAARRQSKRRRVPSRRILTAAGLVLRAFGVLLVLFGFWPFLWTILEAVMLFSGTIKSEAHVQAGDGRFALQLHGWPAILFGLTWSGLAWCIALVVTACGHALYAVRDLIDDSWPSANRPGE